ncbi:MAG: DNA-3-methyladenine glycosylase I [Arcticibacterium sp.]|jgi:DNA-3-methyladenine glycosylase I
MSYCDFCRELPEDNVHKYYHDFKYGFPLDSDNELFERLVLEINQAGLSWNTILVKKDNFFKAYSEFDIKTVANYDETERARLLNDAGIIRNKLKVNATIHNANVILELQEEHGSFKAWIEHYSPLTKEEWVKIFKKKFKFVGAEIVNEFLQSTGYLPTPHDRECPVYKQIEAIKTYPKKSKQP